MTTVENVKTENVKTEKTKSKTDKIEVLVSVRETGKHNSRSLRRGQKVPAVIYGPKTKPMNLMADEITVKKYGGHKFESTIFYLKSENKALDKTAVLFKDVQVHPVTRRPTHVDFYAVDMTSAIRVKIAISFEGKAIGLTEGGMLQIILRELEVECLPSDIPQSVVADVSNLGVGDAFHVYDFKLSDKVKVISRPELAVATVNILADEPVAPVAAAAAETAATPAAGAAPAAAPAAAAAGDKKK